MDGIKTIFNRLRDSYLFIEVALVLLVVGGALLGYSIYSNNFIAQKVLGTYNQDVYDNYQWGLEITE
jgi:hypothetical protein